MTAKNFVTHSSIPTQTLPKTLIWSRDFAEIWLNITNSDKNQWDFKFRFKLPVFHKSAQLLLALMENRKFLGCSTAQQVSFRLLHDVGRRSIEFRWESFWKSVEKIPARLSLADGNFLCLPKWSLRRIDDVSTKTRALILLFGNLSFIWSDVSGKFAKLHPKILKETQLLSH